MQSPQRMQRFRSSTGFSSCRIRAFSLHISTHKLQPIQASASRRGSTAAQKPISLSRGLEQALGHAETVALNLWGSCRPQNSRSICRAKLRLSDNALRQTGRRSLFESAGHRGPRPGAPRPAPFGRPRSRRT